MSVEGVFGTDWMLKSLAARPDQGGGYLYKAAKPGQDIRADMPTIGPDTITAAKYARLDGVVIEHGRVMVVDREETVRRADEAGLILWVRRSS